MVTTERSTAEAMRSLRRALTEDRRLRGRVFCEAYSDAIGSWIATLFAEAVDARGAPSVSGLALIAVGGLGRRELCPGSDVDLLLVHDSARGIGAVADALWYPIWEGGFQLDHSVRTPRQTVEVIDGDVKSALSLLQGRTIAGDLRFGDSIVARARRRWLERASSSLGRLHSALEERWQQHGEVAFLLEPDVKLARGGLRDVEALRAASLASPGIRSMVEEHEVDNAHRRLLDVRVALHSYTDRRSDRLMFDDQDGVARRLGLADADELLPEVAAAGRRIAWTTDQIWRKIAAGSETKRAVVEIEPGVVLRGGEVTIDQTASPDTATTLRLAVVSARHGVPIGSETLARIERDALAPPEPWPREVRDAWLGLLACGHGAVPVLETLDHVGVLGRYIREWGLVRSLPQRNAYHRYTVDRHMVETVAEAARLVRSVHRPDLLLVASLLHDIGKGAEGDHSDTGARLATTIAGRMGFVEQDVATIGWLVADHLLLADVATRRDLSDPATIRSVAHRVATIDRLDLLAALTEADSIATGPAAWSPWKAVLVDELVTKTRAFLAGDRSGPVHPAATPEQRALMAEGAVRVIVEASRITVVAPDRPGLLAVVAGALVLERIDVRSATGISEGAMALEVFDVHARDSTFDPAKMERAIVSALADPSPVFARLGERSRRAEATRVPVSRRSPAPRVLFDPAATPRATIAEVRCVDHPGLLSRIARTLSDARCDIGFIRAQTLGHEVVDSFYITDTATGAKPVTPERLDEIRYALVRELGGDQV